MANFGTVGIIAQIRNANQVISAMSQIRRQIGFLSAHQLNLNRSSTNAARGASTLTTALSSTGRVLGTTLAAATLVPRALTAALAAPGRAMLAFGRGVRQVANNLKSLSNEVAAVGFRLTFLASIPIISAIGGAARAASSFESTLVKIINLTDASVEHVREWRDELLELSVALGRTPEELAAGLYAITSAGKTGAEAMELLRFSAAASSIGLGDMETVARAITGIMGAYAQSNLTAKEATDQLIATIDQGNIEATALAGTIGRVTGIAATMGIEFSEVGAFIAAFSRSGVPAEVAVTSLRSAISSILRPTEQSKDAMAAYKITIEDVRASIDKAGLARTLIALTTVFGEDDEALSKLVSTQRGLAGVLFNTTSIAEDYLVIQQKIANSAGTTQLAFQNLAGTAEFQANQFQAAVHVLGITIGTILLPALNEILRNILPIAKGFAEFAKAHPQIILIATSFAILAAAMGPVLIVVGLIGSSLSTLMAVFGGIIAVLGFVLTPIGLVVAALAGLAALIAGLFAVSLPEIGRRMGITFDNIAQRARGWGRNIVIQLANGIAEATIAVVTALIQIGKAIAAWLKPGSAPKLLPDLREWGASAIGEFLRGMTMADMGVFKEISDLAERFFRSLTEDILPETDVIPAILNFRKALAQAFSGGGGTVDLSPFGELEDEVSSYIDTLSQLKLATDAVTAAQKNLADTQERYSNILKPLNNQMKAINDEQREIADALRLEAIRTALAEDLEMPDIARRLAELEISEILTQQQIDAVEDQRDTEVALAEAQLAAAEEHQRSLQAQADLQRDVIDQMLKQNDLIQEQIALLERLAEAVKDAAAGGEVEEEPFEGIGGLGGFTPGLPPIDIGSLNDIKKQVENWFSDLESPWTTFKETIGSVLKEITKPFAPLLGDNGLFAQLQAAWADVFINSIGPLGEFRDSVSDVMDNWVVPALTDLYGWLTPLVSGALLAVWNIVKTFVVPIFKDLNEEWDKLSDRPPPANWAEFEEQGGFGAWLSDANSWAENAGDVFVKEFFKGFSGSALGNALMASFSVGFDIFKVLVHDAIDKFNETIGPLFDDMWQDFLRLIGAAIVTGKGVSDFVEALVNSAINLLAASLLATGALLAALASGLWSALLTAIDEARPVADIFFDELGLGLILEGLKMMTVGVIEGLGKAFVGLGQVIKAGLKDFSEEGLAEMKELLLTGFTNLGMGLIEAVVNLFAGAFAIVVGLVTALLGLIAVPLAFLWGLVKGFVTGVIDFFQHLYDELVGNSIVPDLMQRIEDLFVGVVKTLIGADGIIPRFIKSVLDMFTVDLSDALVGDDDSIFGKMVKRIADWIGIDLVVKMILAIAGMLVSILPTFYNAGVQIIENIIAGITSGLGTVGDILNNLGSGSEWEGGGSSSGSTGGASGNGGSNAGGGGSASVAGVLAGIIGQQSAMVSSMPAMAVGGGMGGGDMAFNMGPVNINNQMDEAVFEARVERVIKRSFRR